MIPKLDELVIYDTDNGGLALTKEGVEWFTNVTKTINLLVEKANDEP